MAKHKLKTRILTTLFVMMFSFMVILAGIVVGALYLINQLSSGNIDMLSGEAANRSSSVIGSQIKPYSMKLAETTALVLEEQLLRIENITSLMSDTATGIYTHSPRYTPRRLPFIDNGETPPGIGLPYMYSSLLLEGAAFDRIRHETELIANGVDFMQFAGDMQSNISSIFAAGESGYIISMDFSLAPLYKVETAQRDWYKLAKDSGRLVWSDVFVDVRGRGVMLTCAAPFYESASSGNRVFKGVSGCEVTLRAFEQLIKDADVFAGDRANYVFLLDKQGRKLLASNNTGAGFDEANNIVCENYLNNSEYALFAKKMAAGESGVYTAIDGDNTDIIAYYPLPRFKNSLGWSIGVYFDGAIIIEQMEQLKSNVQNVTLSTQKSINSTVLTMIIATLLVALLAIAASVFLVFHFADSVTRPIVELGDAVEQVSNGNLDVAQTITSENEELDRLAYLFNNMTSRLKHFIKNLARVTAERERLSSELQIATEIQDSMLPHKFPVANNNSGIGFDIYAMMSPAKEVGGDFYDFFLIDQDHLAIAAGDVSGSGLPAALVMIIAKTLIRAYLQQGDSLDKALSETNKQLCANNSLGIFVTVWAGVLEFSSGKLQFITAGHNPPLMKMGGNGFGLLKTPNDPPLGFIETSVYHHKFTLMHPGDVIFLYTDGVINAFNMDGDQYEADRLIAMLNTYDGLTMRELVMTVRDDVQQFSSGHPQIDDITMLGLKLR